MLKTFLSLSRPYRSRQPSLYLLFAVLSFLLISQPIYADQSTKFPQIDVTADAAFPISVGTQMLFAEDSEHSLSAAQAMADPDFSWKKIQKASPNFGFTQSAFWFRFDVINRAPAIEEVYIELPIPFLDNIALYQFSGEHLIQKHHVGDELPFSKRPIEHQNFVMPFNLQPGKNNFLMRIESAGTIEAPLFIWNPQSFLVADGNERLLQGIWFGALAIMVLYNLFLLALLKDISYFHYICFAFSYLMFQASLKGYGFAYVWPNQLSWNSYAISVFIAASNFFAFMLLIRFLDLAKHSRKAFMLLASVAGICALLLTLTFILPYTMTVRINSALAMVTCVFALTLGYWSWYHGNPLAKYFCLAWTSAFGGVAILIASKFGVVPTNFWTNNAGQIGVLAQVALLSFALASRFNREKELRIRAQDSSLEHERLARRTQEELLRAEAHAKVKLEQKVIERTENLQTAMTELESVNKQLEIMSTTDALTGLFNRRHFENCFTQEFKRSIRHKRQLSIVLCDIDHFKNINDQNGHQAGDECLQALANLFKKRISRSGDLVARYGGEEFIVLLGDTSMSQAKIIAEDLRQSLQDIHFEYQGKHIPVTASFGISSLTSTDIQTADQLVTQADIALYRAKDSGRNQVIGWNSNDPHEPSQSD